MKAIAATGLMALLALPGAMAYVSTSDITGAVSPMVPPEAAEAWTQVPVLYLNDDGGLWQEANGIAGLQTGPVFDQEGNQVAGADAYIAGPSMLPGL